MMLSKTWCSKYLYILIIVFGGTFSSLAQSQCLQNYSWATWNNFSSNSSTGSILSDGRQIGVTMTANYELGSTSDIYLLGKKFSTFTGYSAIKNTTVPKTTWAAGQGGKTIMCFSEPVTNPILLLASLGNDLTSVVLKFSEPYIPVFDGGDMKFIDSYSLSGLEGNCIVLFPGTFTCLTIESDIFEHYTNITWGLQPPIFPLDILGNPTACKNVTLAASGGNTYQWSGGETPNNAKNTFKTSGVYKVTSTDDKGCTAVSLKAVNVKQDTMSLINKTICQGQNYLGYKSTGVYVDTFKTVYGCDSLRTLKLTVLENPQLQSDVDLCLKSPLVLSSGLSDKTLKYLWTPNNSTDSTLSVSQAGKYQVLIKSAAGCEAIRNINVLDNPKLQSDVDLCLKSPLVLSSGLSDKTLKYLWTPNNSTDSTLSVSKAGKYQVFVKSLAGCESTRTINVLDNPKLKSDESLCLKSPLVLSSGLSDKTLKYLWTPNNSTDSTLSVSKAGKYQVLVKSLAGCESTRIINVLDNPKLKSDTDLCLKPSLLLSSGLSDKTLKYLWTPNNSTDSTLSVSKAGKYQVLVKSLAGCEASRIINVLDSPTVELGVDKKICEGETIELIPTITGTGNGTFTYRWSNGETTKNLKISRAGNYKLTVSQLSCSASDSMKLVVNPNPKIVKQDSYCTNKPFIVGAIDKNLSYLWEEFGKTSPEITIPNVGVYKLKITNQFGCSVVEPITTKNCGSIVFAPNTFTPNGDRNNEIFKVFVPNSTILSLDIYNRWGNHIYTNNLNPEWDGTTEGIPCSSDTFIYIVRHKNIFDNIERSYFGEVLLIR